jgi:hypothetical protein
MFCERVLCDCIKRYSTTYIGEGNDNNTRLRGDILASYGHINMFHTSSFCSEVPSRCTLIPPESRTLPELQALVIGIVNDRPVE